MNKPYLTRKNLICLSLSIFYSIILVFTGLCLDGNHNLMNKNNPIAQLGNLFNFDVIKCGLSAYACLFLVSIYIIVFVGVILYEIRYAIVNNKNPLSGKMFLTYILSFLCCFVLSMGVGVLIQHPLTKSNIQNLFKFIWQSMILTTLIYIVLALLIGGVLLFVVNFLLVDKPYKFFQNKNLEIIEDDEENVNELDVTANFDEIPNITNGGQIQGGTQAQSIESQSESIVKENSKLEEREKVFPALSKMDIEYEGFEVEKIKSEDITLEELCVKFRNYLAKEEKLYFDIETIRFFISAFNASHFMILEGLSGTGKSSLPRYFAKFINANVLFLPVQATWRDKTNLIGYFNDFSKKYTETDFLIGLYHGNYNPDMIHIYVLDEMNISRVEYYFADFLSILEYPKDEWKLKLMELPYDFIPPLKLVDGIIDIKENSYFVGTANKDDSTFTISDKVYDRAITMDFNDRNIEFEVTEDVSTINLSYSKLQSLYKDAKEIKENNLNKDDLKKLNVITDYIYETFDVTFGNRILNQINELVPVYVSCGGTKEEALDILISRKIISKLEGRFEEYVKNALKELLNLIIENYKEGTLKHCEKEIKTLMRRL